ncbi:GntR family transcriptional regulator [Falsiroseomonas tokyonensis]|uniref:GntR family transcriptional regulator n=1 Tax=Falsiroseomonas tokyonensis TaxID=430521 RepID=A0ABV7BM87_9PROT|nr:GntR family transcriptional regulator [Falsiroseomonas tokyonensis]MBU8536688.1 GntR family transcriptional regulator [Falsiroseomonas tokyonensis]
MPPPTASTPAYAILRDRLRTTILSGAWPPGTHRTLGALALEHRVSISPVREALLSLEGEGLVEIRQHRGAIVPLLDAKLFADLYDLRGALQALMARRAAECATPAQLEGIAAHAAGFAAAAERADAAEALRHNEAFHAAIDSAAGNPQAQAVVAARTAFVNAVRLRLGYGPARLQQAAAQHETILAALRARKPEAAAEAAFGHVESAKRDLLERFAEEQGRTPEK